MQFDFDKWLWVPFYLGAAIVIGALVFCGFVAGALVVYFAGG